MSNVHDILRSQLVREDPRPEGEAFDVAGNPNFKVIFPPDPYEIEYPANNIVETSTADLKIKKGK